MKTSSQIVHHLRQRVFRHQKKYLAVHLKRIHYNCKYNVMCRKDYFCTNPKFSLNFDIDVPVSSLSKLPSVSKMMPCDSYAQSVACSEFEHQLEKEDLKKEFREILLEKQKHPSELAEFFPDLAQLLWVLDSDSLESLGDVESEPEPESRVFLTAEEQEGLRLTNQATMEAAMEPEPGTIDFTLVPDEFTTLPEPPTTSLASTTPRIIHRKKQTVGFFSWLSWVFRG